MELTKAGMERRARMLRELQKATVRIARRRVVLRRAMLGTGCVVILALVAALSGTGGKPVSLFAPGGPLPGVAIGTLPGTTLSSRTATPRRAVRLEVVHNDPGIVLRHAAVEAAIDPGTFIDDDDLLAILEAADRPAGLIRRDGLVVVTPDVADVRF